MQKKHSIIALAFLLLIQGGGYSLSAVNLTQPDSLAVRHSEADNANVHENEACFDLAVRANLLR